MPARARPRCPGCQQCRQVLVLPAPCCRHAHLDAGALCCLPSLSISRPTLALLLAPPPQNPQNPYRPPDLRTELLTEVSFSVPILPLGTGSSRLACHIPDHGATTAANLYSPKNHLSDLGKSRATSFLWPLSRHTCIPPPASCGRPATTPHPTSHTTKHKTAQTVQHRTVLFLLKPRYRASCCQTHAPVSPPLPGCSDSRHSGLPWRCPSRAVRASCFPFSHWQSAAPRGFQCRPIRCQSRPSSTRATLHGLLLPCLWCPPVAHRCTRCPLLETVLPLPCPRTFRLSYNCSRAGFRPPCAAHRLLPSLLLLLHLSRVVHEDIAPPTHHPTRRELTAVKFPPSDLPDPAIAPCGRVCQGPNPSSKLRLYSPSSPHPIRLPMKRPILHPPRPRTPPRSGSLQKRSVPCLRSTEPRCPRIQRLTRRRRRRRRPTTTTPFRASCPSGRLYLAVMVMMTGQTQDLP